jgi:NitT/TauT family transport system ATP-binding protein
VMSSHFTQLKRHCLALLHPQKSASPLPRLSPLGAPSAARTQFTV